MTWQQAKKVLQARYDRLRNPKVQGFLQGYIQGYPDRATLKKALIEQEQTMRGSVDQACKKFAQDQTLPELTVEELSLVFQRLQMALSFLRLLEISYSSANGVNEGAKIVPDPNSKVPDWRVLEFLLVDYWHRAGHEQYLFQLTRLL